MYSFLCFVKIKQSQLCTNPHGFLNVSGNLMNLIAPKRKTTYALWVVKGFFWWGEGAAHAKASATRNWIRITLPVSCGMHSPSEHHGRDPSLWHKWAHNGHGSNSRKRRRWCIRTPSVSPKMPHKNAFLARQFKDLIAKCRQASSVLCCSVG